jgi:hypothetical protein
LNLILFPPKISKNELLTTIQEVPKAIQMGCEISINEYIRCWPGSNMYINKIFKRKREIFNIPAIDKSFKKDIYFIPFSNEMYELSRKSMDYSVILRQRLRDKYQIKHFPKRIRALIFIYSILNCYSEEYSELKGIILEYILSENLNQIKFGDHEKSSELTSTK